MSAFQQLKLAIVELTGLSKDALHVYVGLTVLVGGAALLRRPLHSLPLLGAVLALAVLGEWLDLSEAAAAAGGWQWHESLHDLGNTLFWPCVLALFSVRAQRDAARARP